MNTFSYRDGQGVCDQTSLDQVAEHYGTPVYVYSATAFRDRYQQLADAFAPLDPLICYSVKTNGNLAILKLLRDLGSGFDVVSGGELYRVLKIGAKPETIVFAGVGKTETELEEAIRAGVGQFNVESEAELESLASISMRLKKEVNVAIRVNPDVDARTHRHITTGKKQTKFGIAPTMTIELYRRFASRTGLRMRGLHMHIGSQITRAAPYIKAIKKMLAIIETLRDDGLTVDVLDLGGGFGIDYKTNEAPDAAYFAKKLLKLLLDRGLKIIFEPGRFISGNSGVLLTRVVYLKENGGKQFVIVDAAMNDLIRPTFYDAFHFIWPTNPTREFEPPARSADLIMDGIRPMDVVGGICETGDRFAADRRLPPLKAGDLVTIFSAGAYGFSMASQYNARPRPAEVLVDGEDASLIRRRETYDDLVAGETNISKC